MVFYGQNGYIEDFLKAKEVFSDSTKVLVYMAVAKLGEKPTDGITRLNPEGLTAATGKWAEQVAPCARARASLQRCVHVNTWITETCMHACPHAHTHTRTHAHTQIHIRIRVCRWHRAYVVQDLCTA